MNLSKVQVENLQELAKSYGCRLYVSRTQIGIGPTGEPWFKVVYTSMAKRPWDCRSQSDIGLANQMKAIIAQ